MNETAVLADLFRDRSEKGDHIVFCRFFDFIDSCDIESGLFPDIPQRFVRNFAPLCHGLTGQDFDIQPLSVTVFRTPDRFHPLS